MKVLSRTHPRSHLKLGEHNMTIVRIIQESEKEKKKFLFPPPTSIVSKSFNTHVWQHGLNVHFKHSFPKRIKKIFNCY